MATIPMKEAIVILLDVGASMTAGGTSRLEAAVKAVHMLVQQKILFKPKDDIGVVLFGSEETNNDLSSVGYQHVNVTRHLCVPDIGLLREIEQITPGGQSADFIDALIVAMDMLNKRKGKCSRRIFLVTDAGQEVNRDAVDVVLKQFENMECKLNVIGVDFAEEEDEEGEGSDVAATSSASNRPPRSAIKEANERFLREIVEQVSGVVVEADDALELMSYFRAKSVLQRPAFRGNLSISPVVQIPIYMYVKTMEQKFPTLKKISKIAEQAGEDGDCEVKMDRIYVSLDDLDTEVPQEERVKGFKYGKTLVPFTGDDEEATKYRCERDLTAIGFTKASSIRRHHFLSNSQVCVPRPLDDKAGVALSALIHALAETDSVMIVRYVKMKSSLPALGVMIPKIKADVEYLIYQKLPYAEDIRHYPFAPLDVQSMRQSHAPSKAQLAAAELLINSLNLMTAAKDEDGDPMEALKPKHTYNPTLQRFYQCVQSRALHPNTPLVPLDPVIERYVNPDKELFGNARAALENFKALFPVEPADPKKVGSKRTYWADMLAGQDVQLDSYIPDGGGKKQKTEGDEFSIDNIAAGGTSEVGSVHPTKDFNEMIKRRDFDYVETAIKQMQDRILQLVNDSIRDQLYEKAFECVVCLREGCVKEDEPEHFNTFLKLMRNNFEGKRRDEFWKMISTKGLSLIHDGECDSSEVTEEEANQFHAAPCEPVEVEAPAEEAAGDDEVEDLFDMIE
eukprot:TRINITY_DN2207_c0_g1_i1.p1 TRINITY_DN2207_c0_g1~~TRINITY_DN2207_c0_g1_i1.p1  ORF type:complete len:785 (-),score=247.92 TRINITY_DN2207_c0_g1_i1:306-2513(-)